MKKYISIVSCLFIISAFIACNSDAPQQSKTVTDEAGTLSSNAADGKVLFQMNCATCHNLIKDAAGPALNGALARWNNDTARLKAFIRNPARLIREGDPNAVKTAEKFKPVVMTAFPNLSDEELDKLIALFK